MYSKLLPSLLTLGACCCLAIRCDNNSVPKGKRKLTETASAPTPMLTAPSPDATKGATGSSLPTTRGSRPTSTTSPMLAPEPKQIKANLKELTMKLTNATALLELKDIEQVVDSIVKLKQQLQSDRENIAQELTNKILATGAVAAFTARQTYYAKSLMSCLDTDGTFNRAKRLQLSNDANAIGIALLHKIFATEQEKAILASSREKNPKGRFVLMTKSWPANDTSMVIDDSMGTLAVNAVTDAVAAAFKAYDDDFGSLPNRELTPTVAVTQELGQQMQGPNRSYLRMLSKSNYRTCHHGMQGIALFSQSIFTLLSKNMC